MSNLTYEESLDLLENDVADETESRPSMPLRGVIPKKSDQQALQ